MRFRQASLAPFPVWAAGQDEVLNSAKRFVEVAGKGIAGLFLLGQVGAGKTHVGCAILNAFLQQERTGKYCSMTQAFRLFRETWRRDSPTTETEVLKQFCLPELLVVDEIGVKKLEEIECVHLTDIVIGRYDRRLPTILISNLNMPLLTEQVGERVVDRLKAGGKVLVFDWPSLRSHIQETA